MNLQRQQWHKHIWFRILYKFGLLAPVKHLLKREITSMMLFYGFYLSLVLTLRQAPSELQPTQAAGTHADVFVVVCALQCEICSRCFHLVLL